MKSVLLLLALAILSLRYATTTQQTKEVEAKSLENERNDFDLMEILTDCNETFRVEMSYIESLNTSGSFPDETYKTPKCFIRCVLERTEVTSDGEEFDAERSAEVFAKVRKTTPVDAIKDIASNCSNRSESCKCERSYQFLKCVMETEIEKYET